MNAHSSFESVITVRAVPGASPPFVGITSAFKECPSRLCEDGIHLEVDVYGRKTTKPLCGNGSWQYGWENDQIEVLIDGEPIHDWHDFMALLK